MRKTSQNAMGDIKAPEEQCQTDRLETFCCNDGPLIRQVVCLTVPFLAFFLIMFILGQFPIDLFLPLTLLALAGMVVGILFTRKSKYRILFKDREIFIDDLKNYTHFSTWNPKRNRIVMRQNKFQKKKNLGFMKIKGERYIFFNIENYSEVREYVDKHFS